MEPRGAATPSKKTLLTPARWLLIAVACAGLFFSGVGLPYPPVADLDASWQLVSGHAFEQGWRFGRDVVFSIGPWAWLRSSFVDEHIVGARFLWEFAWNAITTAVFVLAGLRLAPGRRLVFWVGLMLLGPLFPDTAPMLVIGGCLALMLAHPQLPARAIAPILVLLGLLALVKFTFMLVIGGGLVLVTISQWIHGRRLGAVLIPAGALALLCVWWVLAGQDPIVIPDYVSRSLEFSRGYSQAMGVREHPWVFVFGILAVVLNGAWGVSLLRHSPDRRLTWPLLGLLAGLWFVTWKHGFTRADGHVMAWFFGAGFIALAAPALPGLTVSRKWGWHDLVPVACLAGFAVFDFGLMRQTPHIFTARVRHSADALLHPLDWLKRFEAGVAANRSRPRAPELPGLVGQSTIDAMNSSQGELILAGLNYRPRPVFQSYSAYTPRLLELNQRFLRSARAPEYMMVRLNTIDGRHPMLDDSLLLLDLPRLYELRHQGTDWLLFQRKSDPVPEVHGEVVRPRFRINPGQVIPFDFTTDRALWLKAWALPSRLGKARTQLYRTSMLYLTIVDDSGHELRHRVIPGMLETGFIVHPVVTSEAEFAALTRGEARRAIRSIRFDLEAPDHAEFWTGIDIELVKIPHLPTEPTEPWAEFVRSGISNIAPERAFSDTVTVFQPRPEGTAFLLHPIGELVFRVGEARQLSARIGIMEGAYTGEAHTDGVDFVILSQAPDGTRSELWRRTLAPLTQPGDRGALPLELAIPDGTDKLILQTWPGAAGNSSWDWSFWQGIRIE